MNEPNSEFEKLLKRKADVDKLFEKSVNDLKYVFLQQHKYEIDLMKSYYFQKEVNPSNIVSKVFRNLTETEKKALVKSLEDKNKDRRLFNSSTSRLSGKQKKFSTSWATASFQKALTKCKLPNNSRHLRQILKNNSQFLKKTGIDGRVLVDFLNENFFFETNLCLWVYNREEIISGP